MTVIRNENKTWLLSDKEPTNGAKIIHFDPAERRKRQLSQAHKSKGPHHPPDFVSAKNTRPVNAMKKYGAHPTGGTSTTAPRGRHQGAHGEGDTNGRTQASMGGGFATGSGGTGGWGKGTSGGSQASAARGRRGRQAPSAPERAWLSKVAVALQFLALIFTVFLLARSCGGGQGGFF